MLTHLQARPIPPTRVVLLGASGFVSRALQTRLAAAGLPFLAIGSSEIDLSLPDSAARLAERLHPCDTVVMLAALTPDKGRDVATLVRNLRMAEHIVAWLAAGGRCTHFVYLSSDAVYDAHQIPLDEDSSREPTDLYALTHTAREMMLQSALEGTGIPLAIVRPTTLYGPGDTHRNYGPNRFVRTAIADGVITLFGEGEERRSQVYIDDAAEILTRLVLYRSRGTLNLANRPAVSFRDVAECVIRHAGRAVRIESVERVAPVRRRPFKPTQIARFIYTLGRPTGPVIHRTFANGALFKAFPDFAFLPLEEGIRRFAAAERKEKAGP